MFFSGDFGCIFMVLHIGFAGVSGVFSEMLSGIFVGFFTFQECFGNSFWLISEGFWHVFGVFWVCFKALFETFLGLF